MKTENILLIGFMGTGKTSVARYLARKIKWQVLDIDTEIEKAEKRSIAQIFSDSGEPYFRRVERRMLQKALKKKKRVISTGGGIVVNPLNIRDMQSKSTVVCLTAGQREIYSRTSKNKKRPLLNTKNAFQTMQKLLKSRRPLYKKAAAFSVSTTGQTACESAKKIIKKLGQTK